MGDPPPLFRPSVITVQSAASARFQTVVKRQIALKITALQLASTQLSELGSSGLGDCTQSAGDYQKAGSMSF